METLGTLNSELLSERILWCWVYQDLQICQVIQHLIVILGTNSKGSIMKYQDTCIGLEKTFLLEISYPAWETIKFELGAMHNYKW